MYFTKLGMYNDIVAVRFGIAITKVGMYNDIVAVRFGIAIRQISSIFDSYLSVARPYFRFRTSISMDFHETSYQHWYCRDLVKGC